MASSFENEEEYEAIDDKNIHSKRCDVYDCVNGEIVQVGSIFSLSGYLSLYTKATEEYIATRINTHSVYFTCIKDDKLYTYGYNTNNIQEDTVDYEEDGEYYDYAYGTRNYDDAIRCNILYFFSININDPMGLLRIVALNGFLDKFEFVFFAIAVDIKSVSLACFELDQL